MGKKKIEILVGSFVLLGMLGLVFLALQAANLGSVGGGDTYTVQARFDNIGGLKPRAPVRSAGVLVGRVKTISLDAKTFQGVVTMEIEREYQFPKDSAAKILTAGPAGRPVRGPGARRRRRQPGPGRHHRADAVGGGAGEPHRPVRHRQGRQRRVLRPARACREPGSDSVRDGAAQRQPPLAVRSRWSAPSRWRRLRHGAAGRRGARAAVSPVDPWENLNRKVFAFNEAVDEAVLKPVAEAYRDVLPQLVRTGVGNVFGNFYDAWSVANQSAAGQGAERPGHGHARAEQHPLRPGWPARPGHRNGL